MIKKIVYSNLIYFISSLISFKRELYLYSFTIFCSAVFSSLKHYYTKSSVYNYLDWAFAIYNFAYGYVQCFLADNRMGPKIVANIINVISAYYFFNTKNYEYNHTIWHLLNGSASIIISTYGEDEEKIYNKLKDLFN